MNDFDKKRFNIDAARLCAMYGLTKADLLERIAMSVLTNLDMWNENAQALNHLIRGWNSYQPMSRKAWAALEAAIKAEATITVKGPKGVRVRNERA